MELSTAALVAMLTAVVAVCIGAFTGTIGQHTPHLRPATRHGTTPRTNPVQQRAELRHPSPAPTPRPAPSAPPPRPAVSAPALPPARSAPAPRPAPSAPAPRPAPSASTRRRAAPPSPASVVTAYYAALDAHRFRAAWRMLGPPVRSSFGGFAAWRAGFASTVSSRPRAIRVALAGRRAVVTLVLIAADRSPRGVVRRRFAVRGTLSGGPQGWVASAVSATRG